jgi:putative acetyltransferase
VIAVRPAEPADAARLVELSRLVAAEPSGWLLGSESERSAAEERRYLRAVRRHPDARVYVAVIDGEIVGRLSLARDPHPSSRHVADLGLLVDAGHRRRGIGRRLLEEAVSWARASGVAKLELHVFPWNGPAIALYDSFGFTREGYRVAHYRRDGDDVDAILMAYHVTPPGSGVQGAGTAG